MSPELISNLAGRIDHTLLRPDATFDQIKQLCQEAEQHKFAAICVAPCWINYVEQFITTPTIGLATVIGFPHGNGFFLEKVNSANAFVYKGVNELDVVVNIGFIKSGDWASVEAEVELMAKLKQAHMKTVKVKYIVEVGYLTDEELYRIADILIKHKIDYIKTCTGYGPRGATVEDIAKIKAHVGNAIKIKASGGIKDGATLRAMVDAGADRVGTSSSVKILEELGALA